MFKYTKIRILPYGFKGTKPGIYHNNKIKQIGNDKINIKIKVSVKNND